MWLNYSPIFLMYYVTDRKNSSSRPVTAVQSQQTVLELEPIVIPKEVQTTILQGTRT